MEESKLEQNMTPEAVQECALDRENINEKVINSIEMHFNSLPERPDYDGYITLREANSWYKEGNGQPLFVDLRKINLSGIASLGENYVGEKNHFNLLMGASHNINDGLVYGNITFVRGSNNTVRALADTYDFDYKSWGNPLNWIRNIETAIGSMFAGNGNGYLIFFYGTAPIKPLFPWIE